MQGNNRNFEISQTAQLCRNDEIKDQFFQNFSVAKPFLMTCSFVELWYDNLVLAKGDSFMETKINSLVSFSGLARHFMTMPPNHQ